MRKEQDEEARTGKKKPMKAGKRKCRKKRRRKWTTLLTGLNTEAVPVQALG